MAWRGVASLGEDGVRDAFVACGRNFSTGTGVQKGQESKLADCISLWDCMFVSVSGRFDWLRLLLVVFFAAFLEAEDDRRTSSLCSSHVWSLLIAN